MSFKSSMPIPILQLVRVGPVDQPLHLLRRRLLPVRQLEQHIQQDRPERHQLRHERRLAGPARFSGLRLLAVHAREQRLPAPLAQRQPALAGCCLQLRELLLAHLRAQSFGAERRLHHATPPRRETTDDKGRNFTVPLYGELSSQRNQQVHGG